MLNLDNNLYTVEDIKKRFGVKSHKETNGGLIAIYKRKIGYWYYFRFNGLFYMMSGSTIHFEK